MNASSARGLIYILASPFLWAWRGYVVVVLWAWFAVPMGGPALSIPVVVGLSAAWSTFALRIPAQEPDDDVAWRGFIYGALSPAIALAVGAIARLFL